MLLIIEVGKGLQMSFFITLIELTDGNRRELEAIPKVHSMIHRGLSLPEYRRLLHELYHIVWHFCPVMANAAARCDERLRGVRFELYERIEEEKGHDGWVLEDIETMGGDPRAAREALPSAATQAMIAFNYYASERIHPCSVLGMLYTLEVISSVYGGRVAESISRALAHDAARGGFKFLSSHATLDVDHMAKLNRLIKTIDDPVAQGAIVNSTKVNFHHFGQLFRDGGPLVSG